MTEAEWLASADPWAMIEFLCGRVSERKLRLFAAHTFRNLSHYLPGVTLRRELELLEGLAEGTATLDPDREQVRRSGRVIPPRARARVYHAPEGDHSDDANHVAIGLVRELVSATPAGHAAAVAHSVADGHIQQAKQLPWLADIFGNPFRPVAFPPEWQTDTALSLARQMYESRDFGAMPVLADALQDAGCDSAEVLDHCRAAGPHVRGCWVVDLVLGKE